MSVVSDVGASSGSKKDSAVTQQVLKELRVETLKNLKDVTISFKEKPLTALMGANGNGKSTVLHALACSFAPPEGEDGYKFPQFFKPNDDARWDGSRFSVKFDHRIGSQEQLNNVQEYAKLSDRWSPKYDRRPKRHVRYITISECVPEVEIINTNTHVHYIKGDLSSASDEAVRQAAGKILNRSYDKYHSVEYKIAKRNSIGVSSGALTYSALSMSSGEQRVFRILATTFSTPKHSLILIDEIDLFLHEDALRKLITTLSEHCTKYKKQIVFTSHFPPIATMKNQVSVITLHKTPTRTVAWTGYSHEAIRHITGVFDRPLTVYVEDDLSKAIVSECAIRNGVRPYLSAIEYGPADNAYSLASGLILSGASLASTLIITDGDVIRSRKDKLDHANRVLTGTEDFRKDQRKQIVKLIRMYHARSNETPEQVLHRMLCELPNEKIQNDEKYLVEAAQSTVQTANTHDFVNRAVSWSGESREVCLAKICRIASRHKDWDRFTKIVNLWLRYQRNRHNLVQNIPVF